MINIRDIEAILVEWVETYTGFATGKVAIQEDNGPKPDAPYISVRIGPITPIGQECRSNVDNSGIVKISGNRNMVVNLQAYGLNAFGVLESLLPYTYVEASQELLFTQGLSFIGFISPVRNLTGLNDLEYEERAQVDLTFRFSSQLTGVDVGYIETAEIGGELKNPDKTIDINIDLT